MKHKMVNLCDASYEASKGINNFSQWVRTKVLTYASGSQETAISATSSRQLMAVVLSRQQEEYGWEAPIVQYVLELIGNEDLV